ncbi:MAG: hypothetical protein JO353_13375 [Phycisphaerae bacterium]|nr:hypothetical protein [Phycisphaerae bacterium]
MKRRSLVVRSIALGAAALGALCVFGCQHQHSSATTQTAVAPNIPAPNLAGPNISATALPAPTAEVHPAEARPVANATPAPQAAPSQGGRSFAQRTGGAFESAGQSVGHGVMVAGRTTVDVFTKSAVPIRNTPPESLSAPTIDVDEAMQARDWNLDTAYYANGSTVAGPIGFRYQPAPNQPFWRANLVEPAIFGLNILIMPYEFFRTPPWKAVAWKGATVQPTYTAVPPLPPENAR